MVDDQFSVYAEGFVEDFLKSRIERGAGNVSEGEKLQGFQFCRYSATDSPEICERPVSPEDLPETHFVQFGNADAVLVRLGFLRNDVHGYLGQEQVCADAGCGRDACIVEHIAHHRHGQLMGGHSVSAQIICYVDEHLINGIHDDVFRCHILEVGSIDATAVLLVQTHPGRCDDIGNLQRWVAFQSLGVKGSGGKLILFRIRIAFDGSRADSGIHSLTIHLPDTLDDLKQTWTPGHLVRLQCWRNSQTDCFFRTAFVCNNEIGGQRIQVALDAFNTGIETLGIDRHVLAYLFCQVC